MLTVTIPEMIHVPVDLSLFKWSRGGYDKNDLEDIYINSNGIGVNNIIIC